MSVASISIRGHLALLISTCMLCSAVILGVMLAKLDLWKGEENNNNELAMAHLKIGVEPTGYDYLAQSQTTETNNELEERITESQNGHMTTEAADDSGQHGVTDRYGELPPWTDVITQTTEQAEEEAVHTTTYELTTVNGTVNASEVLECLLTQAGLGYNGTENVTRGHIACQRWDSQTPHNHEFTDHNRYIEQNITEASNYCRNPDMDPLGVWCYTSSPRTPWDYCGIPYCWDLLGEDENSLAQAGYTPTDCKEMWDAGDRTDDVYTVNPGDGPELTVFCDLNGHRRDGTDGGGWTVIQRRVDGTEDFNREFDEYRTGFGDMRKNFWIGLDILNRITSEGDIQLHIYLEQFNGEWAWARYDSFSVSNLLSNYRLHFTHFNGTAGDAFRCAYQPGSDMLNMAFSSKDADNDLSDNLHCSEMSLSGWWFADSTCSCTHLNGPYQPDGTRSYYGEGITWLLFSNYSLRKVEMKVRRLGGDDDDDDDELFKKR